MQLTVRILSILSSILAVAAVGLFAWTWQAGLPDTDLRGYLFIPVGALGVLLGLVTFIVGVVATAMRRQIAWLVGLVVAGLAAIGLPVVATVLEQAANQTLASNPACQTTPYVPQCQSSGWQIVVLNAPVWLALAVPLLVGLVALLASLQRREVPAAAGGPRS
jgi:hypothetical protein